MTDSRQQFNQDNWQSLQKCHSRRYDNVPTNENFKYVQKSLKDNIPDLLVKEQN